MNARICVLASAAFAGVLWGDVIRAGELVLAERGKPCAFSVALPVDPTESERFAAEELKTYVRRLTDVEIGEAGERKIRFVRAERELGPDGFRLRACDGDLELSGGRYGLLYAAYEILETYGGVEWFSPECEVVPRIDRLALPADLDRTERPAFEGREVLWSAIAENPDHATRMRLHGIYTGFKPRHAGNIYRFGGNLMNCHTFHKLVPKAKYAKEHPEYFAMRGGKRVVDADERGGMQLCMSNRDVEDIVVAGILDAIRRDPEATYFGLSQNDNEVYCECPDCAAADAEEGTHAGAQMRFVNRVAARIEKEHPDKIIETLAYQYTRKAPKKTRLRKNVMPCLCSIECDFAHPLATGLYRQNVSFREDLRDWAAMTDRLYVWDYTVNFGNYPGIFPNYNVLQANLMFFRDNGVKSVFEQGAHGGARGAEFEVLKAWLLSKWLWNPDYDEEKLLGRFFRGYYGKAAKYVRKYFDVLRAKPRPDSVDKGLLVFSSVESTNLVTDVFLAQASKCWRLAAAAAEQDGRADVRRNVMLGEFSVDYMRFLRLRNRYVSTPGIFLRSVPPATDGEHQDFADLVTRMKAVLDAEPRVKFSENKGIDDGIKRQIREAYEGLKKSAFKPSRSCFIEADRFNLLGAGSTMFREEDKDASEGKCLRVSLHKYSWDAQLPVTLATFDPGAKYRVRLRAKITLKPDAPEGRVFDCGVHDPQEGKDPASWRIMTSQVKNGEWHWYDLGDFQPSGSPYFWMSGGYFDPKKFADNPCAERVLVDRFEISRVD